MTDPALFPPPERVMQQEAVPNPEPEYTAAQLYQMNQDHLASSIVDRPLISEEEPISVLRAEYENGGPDSSYVAQIDYLTEKGWTHVRRAKGDGDCFYRSLAFAFVARILRADSRPTARSLAQSTLDTTKPLLGKPGPEGSAVNPGGRNPVTNFEWDVMEMFYDALAEAIEGAGELYIYENDGSKVIKDESWLTAVFQDAQNSNCITTYLRFLTSAVIRSYPEEYIYFLTDADNPYREDPITVEDFCLRYVEAGGKEADHVQIMALARALALHIEIAYLDGRSKDGKVDFVEFNHAPPGKSDVGPIVLLYRPGHYDVLVKRDVVA